VAVSGVLGHPVLGGLTAVAGLVLLAATLRLDARLPDRLLPHRAADLSTAPALGYAAILCLSAGAIGFSVYGSALLQTRLGLGPLPAGYAVASESIGWTFTALWVARTPPKGRAAMIRLGAALVALGLAGCALTGSSAGLAPIALSGLVMGGGFGLCWSFVSQRILGALPEADGAVGSAAIPMMQILGNAVGAALAGVVANGLGFANGFSLETADRAAPLLFGGFVPLAALGVWAAWRLAGLRSRDAA
jgi:MFS family permease